MSHYQIETGPFAIVPVWVLRVCSSTEVVVYAAIASYADGDGQCRPSYNTISQRCAVHADTVKRAIRSMEDKHVLRRVTRIDDRGRQASNAFVLAMVEPADTLFADPSKTGSETGGADLQWGADVRGVTTLDQPGPVDPSLRSGSTAAQGADNGGVDTASKRPRRRDVVFEAVCDACLMPLGELLPSERGEANRAAKELRDRGVSPVEIRRRGEIARERWPGRFRPGALVRNWTLLGQDEDGDQAPAEATEAATGLRRLADRRRQAARGEVA